MRLAGSARLLAATPLVIVLCACTTPPGSAPGTIGPGRVVDLAADFTQARSRVEVPVLDIGGPDDPEVLGRGWAAASETWGDDPASTRSIRWALGGRAEIAVFCGHDGALRMKLLAQPIWFDDAPAQRLAIDIDGEPAGAVTLPQGMGWTETTVTCPPGTHIVGLTPALYRRPRDVHPGATDERNLAVAFDRIEFPDARPVPLPAVASDERERRLRLPIPSQVDYELELPAGAALQAVRITGPEAGHAREASLELEIEPAGQGRVRWRLAPGTESVVHDLGRTHAGRVRVSLRARDSRAGADAGSAFEIVDPRIVFPEPAPATGMLPGATEAANQVPPRGPPAATAP